MAKLQTFDHLRSTKKARTKTVWIAGDTDSVDAYEGAVSELRRVQQNHNVHGTDETAAALEAARQDVKDKRSDLELTAVKFVFRSIGHKKFEQLMLAHQPTKEQNEKAGEEIQFNPETFPAALIAAAAVEPEMTEEQAQEILDSDEWNQAEIMTLFAAALEVNQQRRIVDLGNV